MQIFISYGRADMEAFARELAAWLREKEHVPWLDVEHGIPPGQRFDVRIQEGIQSCDLLLAVLSPSSVRKESFCQNEILYAQKFKKTVLPVRMADVTPPILIITLNFIDASTRREEVLSLIEGALETIDKTGDWERYTPPAEKKWYESGEDLDFQADLVRFSTGFVGREWLFEELKAWVREPASRVCLLVAGVGIGKSAIAAQLTPELDVKGVHFCTRSNFDSCKPVPWIRALIRQLVRQLPGYREILDTGVPEPDWAQPPESLFRTLVSDRLTACRERLQTEDPWVFVIDALDEADPAMVTFLTETIELIPPWMRLVLTSRPDEPTLSRFKLPGVHEQRIDAGDAQQREDMDAYLEQQYQALVGAGILPERPDLLERLKHLSDGNFHYASVLMDALGHPDPKQRLQVDEIGTLPGSLGGLYDRLFRRRFGNVDRGSEAKRRYKEDVRPLVDCLTAAPAPVPESLLVAAAGGEDEEVAVEGLRILSQFLIHEHGAYRLFHESVREWLTDNKVGNPFAAYPSKGHRYLADAAWQEVFDSGEAPCEYILRWLPEHLISARRTEELALLLAEPRYFIALWRMSDEVARAIWVMVEQVEGRTSLLMEEVYAPVVQNPGQYPDDFIDTLAQLFYMTGHPRYALSLFEYQSRDATERGDREFLQRSLGNQALILQELGDLDGAMQLCKEKERICRELGNVDGLHYSLGNQANILYVRGDLDGAMDLYKEQERICRQLGNVDGLAISLGNQANILYARGDLDGAMDLYKEKERICRELGYVDGLQASLGGQANVLSALGDLEGALTFYKEEERICRELGYVDSLQRSLGNQANIPYARGDLEGAMTLYKEKERICRELGNIDGLQMSLGGQANVLSARGDLEGAMDLYKEEERICRELGNVDGLAISLGNQASTLHARGDLEGAMDLYKEQERICRQLGYVNGLQASLGGQANILYARGDMEGAMTLYKKQERICRELGNVNGLQASLGSQANILYARGDMEGAMTLYKKQERICRELGNVDGLQRSLGGQANILSVRGDLEGAMTLYKEHERICRQLGYVNGLQISLGGQALILRVRGDLHGAMDLYKEQERICRELGNIDGLQTSLGGQANILYARGDMDGAMTLYKEKERICRELGNIDGLQTSLGGQANILYAHGDLEGAMDLYKEQERICRALGNVNELQASLGGQTLILQARGDLGGAMQLCKEKERICRELGYVEGIAVSLANRAGILVQQDRRGEASHAIGEAFALVTKTGYASLAEQIQGVKDELAL